MNPNEIENETINEIIAFTQALVRQPSLPGEEAGAAQVVKEKLQALDFDEVWVDEVGSVLATRRGSAPGPRLLFDAHMDVVPVKNPQDWSCDPFGGELRDGKIWGRGATDIKGGLAALAVALGRLSRGDFSGTLLLCASIGEETMEGSGLRRAVEQLKPDFAVIVEPTECQLGVGQKGRTEFWIEVQGKPAHTSRPELGDNAIEHAADMILDLRRLPRRSDPVLGQSVVELVEISSRPFPGECTVPYGCRLRYDRRLVSGETRDSVLGEVQAALSGYGKWQAGFQSGSFTTYTGLELHQEHFYPGWVLPESSPWLARAERGLREAGIEPQRMLVPYCTNGSYTAGEAGIPSVIFGPSTIKLAHVVDEYVEVAELLRAWRGLCGLARSLDRD